MNPSKPDQFDDDDDNQIRRLVALAGDPTAALGRNLWPGCVRECSTS